MEQKTAEVTVPFQFKECVIISKATGEKASSLKELREKIMLISDESLYYHTYQYFIRGHLQEYTNRFAEWAAESIEERALSEQFSNLDPYEFNTIEALREELIRITSNYLENNPEPRPVLPGDEFYFNETLTMVFEAGLKARNLAEFLIAVRYVEPGSIYFHFYEARNRSDEKINDFSSWFALAFGKEELADKINNIDPFMYGIEGIRELIIELVEAELRKDMEEF